MTTLAPFDLLNDAWRRQVDDDRAAIDRLQRARTTMLLAQNSARSCDPDGPALPRGTASRHRAERLWRLSSGWLEARPRYNVLRAGPEAYGDPVAAATARVEYLMNRLEGRIGLVLAGGHIAAAAAAAVLGVPRRPEWNQIVMIGSIFLLAVPHPSGASFAYNNGYVGQRSAAAISAAVAKGEARAP
jgi:broad specificity phosphatase PhoE